MANHPEVKNKNVICYRVIHKDSNFYEVQKVEWWSIQLEEWREVEMTDIMIVTDIEVSYESTWCEPYEGMEG